MAMAGSFFLAPFALGAAAAAILAFFGVNVGIEWAVFLGVSIVSFLAMRPLARKLDDTEPTLGVGATRHVGQIAQVTQPIGAGQEPGMVLLGAEKWRAESSTGEAFSVGENVVVAEVRGTRLIVDRAAAPDTQPTS